MKKMLIKFVMVLLVVGYSSTGISEILMSKDIPDCDFEYKELLKRMYSLMYEKKDIESAENFFSVFSDCTGTNHRDAVMLDLKGEIARAKYLEDRNMAHFLTAEKNFVDALKLKTTHDEYILWHVSMLFMDGGNPVRAKAYINKLLGMDVIEDPNLYLGIALRIAVLLNDWDSATKLINILSKRYKYFYMRLSVLMPTVMTLCHQKRYDDAGTLIKNTKKARPKVINGPDFKGIQEFYEKKCRLLK